MVNSIRSLIAFVAGGVIIIGILYLLSNRFTNRNNTSVGKPEVTETDKLRNIQSSISQTAILSPTPTVVFITYRNQKVGYEFQYPSQFSLTQREHGEMIKTTDNNQINISATQDTSSTIAAYLEKLDEQSKTAYEGQPSRQVQSTKKTVINKLNCIQRQEYLLAADITQQVTYFKKGSTFLSVALEPVPGNFLEKDKVQYQKLLSTITFFY